MRNPWEWLRIFRKLRPFRRARKPHPGMGGWKLEWAYFPVVGGAPGQVAKMKVLASPNGKHLWLFTHPTGQPSRN